MSTRVFLLIRKIKVLFNAFVYFMKRRANENHNESSIRYTFTTIMAMTPATIRKRKSMIHLSVATCNMERIYLS